MCREREIKPFLAQRGVWTRKSRPGWWAALAIRPQAAAQASLARAMRPETSCLVETQSGVPKAAKRFLAKIARKQKTRA